MTLEKNIITEVGNSMFFISAPDINLEKTFTCGQCFRWHGDGESFTGVASGRAVRVTQAKDGFYIYGTTESDINNFWYGYFDLGRDYSSVAARHSSDPFICAAAEYGAGIHILKQDPVETIFSFIISSNNNISRIGKIIESFCGLYGNEISFENKTYKTFPTLSEIYRISEDTIGSIRSGFRDKYLLSARDTLMSDNNFIDKITCADDITATKLLSGIKGIGPKVCGCIMLFGFSRGTFFPKDVWINRVIDTVYGGYFDSQSLGNDAGLIQQYFFFYGRSDPSLLSKWEGRCNGICLK